MTEPVDPTEQTDAAAEPAMTPERLAEILPGLLEAFAPLPAQAADDDGDDEVAETDAPKRETGPRPDPVGYGRPPASGRFTKGRSGNPMGRPRTRPADPARPMTLTQIERALRRRVEVEINGRRRRLPLTHALVSRLTERALEDRDVVALREMLRLCAATEAAREARARREREEAEAAPTVRWVGGAADLFGGDLLSGGLMQAFSRGLDAERAAAWEDDEEEDA